MKQIRNQVNVLLLKNESLSVAPTRQPTGHHTPPHSLYNHSLTRSHSSLALHWTFSIPLLAAVTRQLSSLYTQSVAMKTNSRRILYISRVYVDFSCWIFRILMNFNNIDVYSYIVVNHRTLERKWGKFINLERPVIDAIAQQLQSICIVQSHSCNTN